MNETKKALKENKLKDAAEKVFANVGFKNAKMEDIAKEAGVTKVTLYSYFKSKENLYMAITYRALQLLIDRYYKSIDENKDKPGLEGALAIMQTFMEFCEQNYLYTELTLEYFALVRSTSQGADTSRLTEAMQESIYYRKLEDIQILPFKLASNEIRRGIDDGSIQSDKSPMFLTLHAWASITGFARVIAASGSNSTPMFNIDLRDLKEYMINSTRYMLQNKVLITSYE